jgi:hypothetical protein
MRFSPAVTCRAHYRVWLAMSRMPGSGVEPDVGEASLAGRKRQ